LFPEGQLSLLGATLDLSTETNCGSYSGETWTGVLYDFSAAINGTPWVTMDNSIIKNAKKAFANNAFYTNPNLVLRVYGNSEFIDNKNAINFTNVDGIVWISNTNFVLNESFNDPGDAQIKLFNSKALFTGTNSITNNTSDVYYTEIDGFNIYNSNVNIYGTTVENWFNGFVRGQGIGKFLKLTDVHVEDNEIYGLDASYRYGSMEIKNSTFINNNYGALITDKTKATDLLFEGNYVNNAPFGFQIERNSFGFFYNNIF
jgi:hypothetical protein